MLRMKYERGLGEGVEPSIALSHEILLYRKAKYSVGSVLPCCPEISRYCPSRNQGLRVQIYPIVRVLHTSLRPSLSLRFAYAS